MSNRSPTPSIAIKKPGAESSWPLGRRSTSEGGMWYIVRRGIICLLLITVVRQSRGQEFTDLGMLATGVLSRTRAGNDFELGDMLYVTAIQPGGTGGMYVSAHMEYSEDSGTTWQPIPPADSELGKQYRSGRYPGVRDFVQFMECDVSTTRRICLFMPYRAASLPENGVYQRRYTLRLWDRNNDPIKRVELQSEDVSTARNSSGDIVLVSVTARACSSLEDSGNTEPIPESQDEGALRLFSTNNGNFVCPDGGMN